MGKKALNNFSSKPTKGLPSSFPKDRKEKEREKEIRKKGHRKKQDSAKSDPVARLSKYFQVVTVLHKAIFGKVFALFLGRVPCGKMKEKVMETEMHAVVVVNIFILSL